MGADARGIDEAVTYVVDLFTDLFYPKKPEPKEMSHVVAGSNNSFAVSTDRLNDSIQQVSKSTEEFHNPETPKTNTMTTAKYDIKVPDESHRIMSQESKESTMFRTHIQQIKEVEKELEMGCKERISMGGTKSLDPVKIKADKVKTDKARMKFLVTRLLPRV
ncbi:MAG: hypothetical protein HAW66_04945 [Shewanella sp.]|nr:hypothetical protein [Shewanella sp.]